MLVKLSGRILSVLVLDGSVVKLARCVEMDSDRPEEIESVLHPTVAYIEDELKSRAAADLVVRIRRAERGVRGAALAGRVGRATVEPLRSRFGTPGAEQCGTAGISRIGGGLNEYGDSCTHQSRERAVPPGSARAGGLSATGCRWLPFCWRFKSTTILSERHQAADTRV